MADSLGYATIVGGHRPIRWSHRSPAMMNESHSEPSVVDAREVV